MPGVACLGVVAAILVCLSIATPGSAEEKRYDTGATDTTIKIGNTAPYSGALSSNGIIARTEGAYFKMINDQGGVNGRKIEFISYDDAYSPPKTVEQTRKLVEGDEVLLLFNQLGTPTTMSVIKYVNARKVPQLFIAAGGTIFGDQNTYPWSMGFQPSYQSETRIYGRYLHDNYPDGKIAVLSSNDDFGRDNIKGLKDGLGDAVGNIVAEVTYETSAPTIDSELVKLKFSGANVFVNFASAKFAAQAIKKAAEIGWKPVHILHGNSQSISAVLKPAGLDNAKDIITASYSKDPADQAWIDDPGLKRFSEFVDKYMPGEDKTNFYLVYGYNAAQAMVEVLSRCKDDLTRANIIRQAEALSRVHLDMLLPDVTLSTSPADHYPIEQMQLQKFDGQNWVRFGSAIEGTPSEK
ncbi:ABC transporter substrate-binding protein [Bradyrhizobium erythrophlei]|uniref:ABC transporter substrate-binding protein n=1 Tax=Bradyrhizobium erythrophlei TaxID=1437360 RepID=UPI0035EF27A3